MREYRKLPLSLVGVSAPLEHAVVPPQPPETDVVVPLLLPAVAPPQPVAVLLLAHAAVPLYGAVLPPERDAAVPQGAFVAVLLPMVERAVALKVPETGTVVDPWLLSDLV